MKTATQNNLLFLSLTTFSRTGGIEKFNKCLLKALSDNENGTSKIKACSLHDSTADEHYFQNKNYKGFSGKQLLFVLNSIAKAQAFDQIILGHINLAIIGCLIKRVFPKKRIVLITHGIEVWQPVTGHKKTILEKADLILTVSNFTKSKLLESNKVDKNKIGLLHNTIDPYFPVPSRFEKSEHLRQRYGITADDYVLFTLTRLNSAEKYKGYDMVIKCLPALLKTIPNLRYVIAGKYDREEKERIDNLIKELQVADKVIFAGYVKETEIGEHFQMSDLFVMPSYGEGFGIVYIEAMVCGLPVVAGNQDGSVDALQNGELGTLVNPHSKEEITESIIQHYNNKAFWKPEQKYALQQKTLGYFGFDAFKERLQKFITDPMS